MLSISQGEKLPPKLAVKASLKLKKAAVSRLQRTAADVKMNKVHQDEDYIYPALGQYGLARVITNYCVSGEGNH